MPARGQSVAALLLCACLSGCAEAPAPRLPVDGARPLGWVDVLVGEGEAVTVSCDGRYLLADGSGGTLSEREDLGAGAVLSLSDGELFLDGRGLGLAPLELRPTGQAVLACDGTRYRGLLRIEVSKGASTMLKVLNRLDVDDYLKGVVPGEMPERFGLEALSAQAVAARSYALAEIGRRGWLHADQRSQVYGGLGVETFITNKAIQDTARQVLTHDGAIITAWFHSTCGGATRPARLAFNYPPQGVFETAVTCNDCRDSPTWSWTRRLPGARVCRALGLPEGPLSAVTCEPATFPSTPERIVVEASGLRVTVTAREFRAALSKGQPFEEQLLSTRWGAAPRIDHGALIISGRGWGHGVGLCQYGAGGFAARGADYRAILKRYYPAAELVRLT